MSTTNNDALDMLKEAIDKVQRMNYTLAIRATFVRMLDECEKLEKAGGDVTEVVNLIRIANDYLMYVSDSRDELPREV